MNRQLREYDLQELLAEIVSRYSSITTVVLFGSRNYGTGSDRSDVDLIIRHESHIKPVDMRNLTLELCPALDLFLCRDNVAISCANDSSVTADTFDALVKRLDGTVLWTREGFSTSFKNWKFKIPERVAFLPTAVVLSVEEYGAWRPRVRDFMQEIEAAGFPSRPYIGATPRDMAEAMIHALRGAIAQLPSLRIGECGGAGRLRSERDLQDLFYLVCKSWLPGLAREEVVIRYDGQDKRADFSYLDSRLVFEFKHVKDPNTKAAVVKTLSGLTEFYTSHANIAMLVNVVLVDSNVDVDDMRWEADYSYRSRTPEVWTTVIRNNG